MATTRTVTSLCIASLCLLAVSCQKDSAGSAAKDPGETYKNYGDDIIGYKNAADGDQNNLSSQNALPSAGGQDPLFGSSLSGSAEPSMPMGSMDAEAYYPESEIAAGGTYDAGGAGGSGPVEYDDDAGVADELDRVDASASAPSPPEIPDLLNPTLDDVVTSNSNAIVENPFFATADDPMSTFSIDVDTGSYTLSRGSLNAGQLPTPESVRIEEFINYFHFHYKQPQGPTPFSIYSELGDCPWNRNHELVMLGIQGQEVELADQPAANLVFLLDVSGSMSDANKLPLLKKGFRMLVRQLRPQDKVAIVVYASQEGVVLNSTPGDQKETILAALGQLQAGGSTAGAAGIQKAYEIAVENFIKGGNNRVILATDGDFNVGISDTDALVEFIAQKRETGVFLSVYGFGDAWNGGNYQDEKMEQLADNGNGIYFYIDGPAEARRAFIHTVSGSLLTIAKDVKVQVEFNPGEVKAFRLIGYENRMLAHTDFSNDIVDAGELGAGLSVTALFEIIPAGSDEAVPEPKPGTVPVIESASGDTADNAAATDEFEPVTGDDLVQIRIRYKDPDEQESQLIVASANKKMKREIASHKFNFAAAVGEFAMMLRGSQYLSSRGAGAVLDQVEPVKEIDAEGAVAEFAGMIERYRQITQ